MFKGLLAEQGTAQGVPLDLILPMEKVVKTHFQMQKKKVVLLSGPTGCGKTALSLLLCQSLGGEVVSADSMQVYRGMDIGTAKASPQERAQAPHHLIDIRDVKNPFNVVDFYCEARHAFEQIFSRGKVPIVVGGAGFYLRTLLYGPPLGPPSIESLRHELMEEMQRLGPEALYERLFAKDPAYAATITKHDRHKIVRALEIITLTGGKVSDLQWRRASSGALDYDFRCWFLTRPREVLYRRLEERCEQMLQAGLVEEVIRLEKEGLRENLAATQAIGYRQTLEYLATQKTEDDYKAYIEKFKIASRHYAKRQVTWFRREPLFRWLDIEMVGEDGALEQVVHDYLS